MQLLLTRFLTVDVENWRPPWVLDQNSSQGHGNDSTSIGTWRESKACQRKKMKNDGVVCAVGVSATRGPEPADTPQKAVVAKRLLSRGGAHFAQMPWQAGYETPCRMRNKVTAWLKKTCLNKSNLFPSPIAASRMHSKQSGTFSERQSFFRRSHTRLFFIQGSRDAASHNELTPQPYMPSGFTN